MGHVVSGVELQVINRENRTFWSKKVKDFGKRAEHLHPIFLGVYPR